LSKKLLFLLTLFLSLFDSLGQTMVLKNDSIENNLDEVIISGTKTIRVVSSLPLNASVINKVQ